MTVNRPGPLAVRRVLRTVVGPVVRGSVGFEVDHPERLPRRREPVMLACNHAAFADTVLLSLAVRPRLVVCGARPRLFRNRRLRALMAVGNVLRVDTREQYLEDCGALLRQGEVLLTYPEMQRNPDGIGTFSTWPSEVALASGVPIVPCRLRGTTNGDPRPYALFVGERIGAEGDPASLTGRVRDAIVSLGDR